MVVHIYSYVLVGLGFALCILLGSYIFVVLATKVIGQNERITKNHDLKPASLYSLSLFISLTHEFSSWNNSLACRVNGCMLQEHHVPTGNSTYASHSTKLPISMRQRARPQGHLLSPKKFASTTDQN